MRAKRRSESDLIPRCARVQRECRNIEHVRSLSRECELVCARKSSLGREASVADLALRDVELFARRQIALLRSRSNHHAERQSEKADRQNLNHRAPPIDYSPSQHSAAALALI